MVVQLPGLIQDLFKHLNVLRLVTRIVKLYIVSVAKKNQRFRLPVNQMFCGMYTN